MNRELIDRFPNEIIKASAGTGKTFALSNRYLQLLASGADCETILATTFTRKGAGEILDRIIERLSDAALSVSGAKKLSTEIEWKLSQDRAAKILHELLGNLHRLEISTLDSFFNRVAKVFSLELGLPPTWDIIEEQQVAQLHDDAIQAVLQYDTVHDLLHLMTKGEVQRRVADLIRDTVESIYGVYLEAKAPEVWDQLPESGRRLSPAELDAIGLQITNLPVDDRKNIKKEWGKIVSCFENGEWESIIKTNCFQGVARGENTYGKTNWKLKPGYVSVLKSLMPQCLAAFTHRLASQNRSTHELLSQFGEILETTKDETGQLRFYDITNRLLRFVQFWNTDQFSFRLDHQIQHLLLDEFQDTSPVQWKVIRPFAQQVTQADSRRSFFCVGDMKQAIYGWRGGVAEIFDLIAEELPNIADASPLTASYRSSQAVIDFVNRVFSNLDNYDSKEPVVDEAVRSWGNWFDIHTTERTELEGYVTIEMAADCDDSVKKSPNGHFTAIAIRNENLKTATIERIKTLVETIPAEFKIGVLVRTNDEVGQLIFELQQAGIPASEEGGNPLTDATSVEIILSAISLADHPGDDISRFHVSHSPLAGDFGLQPETDLNQADNKRVVASGASRMRDRLVREGYGPTIETLARKLAPQCTRRELLRLQHLVRVAYSISSDNDRWALRPKRFVDYIRDEVKVSDQSGAQVRVMTIHQSKGLEFDVVVLPMKFVTNGWFGHQPQVVVGRDGPTDPVKIACRYVGEEFRAVLPENIQEIFVADRQRIVREELCNLYVAMTRAVHATHVVLSYSAKPGDKSSAGILLSCLELSERQEGFIYEPEPDKSKWYQSVERKTEADAEDVHQLEQFYLPESTSLKVRTITAAIKSGRGMRSTSPSRLEGGDKIKLSAIFDTLDNQVALTRGAMIHGCFELVKWLDDHKPTRAEILAYLQKLDPTLEDYEPFIAQFQQMLELDSINRLLKYRSYLHDFVPEFTTPGDVMLEAYRLEVVNERPFSVIVDDELLSGFIDRVVFVYEGDQLVAADVIDFKTDPVNESTLGGRIGYYRPQLNAYRRAVSQFTKLPLDHVAARIAFVEIGKVVIVDPGPPTNSTTKKKKTKVNLESAYPQAPVNKTKSSMRKSSAVPKPKRKSSKQQRTLWDD